MKLSSLNFSRLFVGKTITNSLQAVFFIIFASILAPEEYGQLSYLISIAGVVSVLFRFGFRDSIIVQSAKENYKVVNQLNVLALLCITIGGISLFWIDKYAALLSFALSLFILNQGNLIGKKQYKKYFLLAVIRGSFFLIIPLFTYFMFGIPGILLGIALSNMIGGFDFLRHVKFRIKLTELQINIKTLTHNFAVEASNTLPKWIDKLLILPLLGFTVVGVYQFNLQILLLCTVLPQALHSFVLSEESSGTIHKKIIAIVLGISGILTVLVISIAPLVMENFFPNYVSGIPSLQILMLSLIPQTISYIYAAKLQAAESTKVGFSVIIKIGFLLLLIYLLAPYDLIGLSFAVLFSTIAYTIFLAILYKKRPT